MAAAPLLLASGLARSDGGGPPGVDGPASSCGDLLVVFDRSGSMALCGIDGESKESIAKEAMLTMIAEFPTVGLGLMVFPDTLESLSCTKNACQGGRVVIDVSPDGAAKVASFLASMPKSCGGTPTGDTMQAAKAYAGWPSAKAHYVVLLTDGMPTCEEGDGCNGRGKVECKNPTKVYDALEALRMRDIRTFIVGFEGKGLGEGCDDTGGAFNLDTLNKMADLGGVPNEASGPGIRYYPAGNKEALKEALRRIAGVVSQATVGGCIAGGGPGGGSRGAADAGALDGRGGSAGAGQGGDGGGGASGSSRPSHPGCACDLARAPADRPFAVLLLLAALVATRRRSF